MKTNIKAVVIGASGYTGAELVRLLLAHPQVTITALTGDSQAGKPLGAVYPHLAFKGLPDLVTLDKVDFSDVDVAFCCLPHGTVQQVVAGLPDHLKVIDLSADFRLADVESYAKWYGHAHHAPQLQKEAVYGLVEHARDAVKKARLVANPGCYPTSAQLPLIPLLKAGIIETTGIVIDAKSGVTGAGRSVKQSNLYAEINDGLSAYSVGAHRHIPEIEQGLSAAAGKAVEVSFTPHLVPMNRGILSTIYAKRAPGKSSDDARAALTAAYANEAFVHVAPAGMFPATHMVRGTNHAVIGLFADRRDGYIILVSVIDNLVKGASGQAVHNMNLMFGFPEGAALEATALFP